MPHSFGVWWPSGVKRVRRRENDLRASGTTERLKQMAASPPESGINERVYEFAWRSVSHLEGRITTLDTKANVLIGLVVGAVAAVGALGKSALEDSDWSWGWSIASGALLCIDAMLAGTIILYCLRTVNPGSRHREGIESALTAPDAYVVWPPGPRKPAKGVGGRIRSVATTLRPHRASSRMKGKPAHADQIRRLSDDRLMENLVYMQTTLLHLVERKLDAYRAAILLTRGFVWYQGLIAVVLFVTLSQI